jgi:translation initiation factor IF-2
MLNSSGESIKKSLPSGAVFLSGFESVPNTGDIIQVVENEKTARERAQKIALIKEGKEQYGAGGMSEILAKIQSKTMNILKIVVKADANGSIEAIKQMISKIENTEVGVKVIHSAVGEITESDIMMASASQGLVIGFNVKVTPRVKLLAEKEKVEVQIYDVIYNLIDDIKAILTGMLQDEEIEVEKGEALVKAIFMTSKKKQIVGVVVKSGAIVSGARVRIMRGEEVLTITEISNVRSFDKDTKEVLEGNECGVMFAKKMDIEEGDVLQCIIKEKRMKTL